MKKYINCIIIILSESIININFLVSILACFFLCFTSVIFTNGFTAKEYTALEVIFDKSIIKDSSISGKEILSLSVSPYITIFIPIISSIPFVTTFCTERISGNIRFVVSRIGKKAYCISKFVSAIFNGALSVMIGFIMYSAVISCLFGYDGTITELIKRFIGMGIYGAISVLPAFFLSSFIKNKYIICCFPFILMHFYYTTISKIQDKLYDKGMNETVLKIGFLYPNTLKEVLFYQRLEGGVNTNNSAIVYHLILCLSAFVGFTLLMNRRLDCGQ